MALGPTESKADAQAADLRVVINAAWVARDIEAGNAQVAAGSRDLHNRIEHRRRSFGVGHLAVTSSFEAHGVNRAINFRDADDLFDLFGECRAARQVERFASE